MDYTEDSEDVQDVDKDTLSSLESFKYSPESQTPHLIEHSEPND